MKCFEKYLSLVFGVILGHVHREFLIQPKTQVQVCINTGNSC